MPPKQAGVKRDRLVLDEDPLAALSGQPPKKKDAPKDANSSFQQPSSSTAPLTKEQLNERIQQQLNKSKTTNNKGPGGGSGGGRNNNKAPPISIAANNTLTPPPQQRKHDDATIDPSLRAVTKASKGIHKFRSGFQFLVPSPQDGNQETSSAQQQPTGATSSSSSTALDRKAMLAQLQAQVTNVGQEAAAEIETESRLSREQLVKDWTKKGVVPTCGTLGPSSTPSSTVPTNPSQQKPPQATLFESVPDTEWWDEPLLRGPLYDLGIKEEALNDLVLQPLVIDGPNVAEPAPPRELTKTKKELQRERHLRRVTAEKEKQQKIKDGLMEKPEDKLRTRNLRTNLAVQSALNPTETEAMVKASVKKRWDEHFLRNEQRHQEAQAHQKEHYFEKLQRLASTNPHVSVFRILGLTEEHLVTKLKINCNQVKLRGVIFWIQRKFVIAVLIGGFHATTFIRNFVERRQGWPLGVQAEMVWAGPISKQTFQTQYFAEYSSFDLLNPTTEDETVVLPHTEGGGKNDDGDAAVAVVDRKKNSTLVFMFDSPVLAMERLERQGLSHAWDVAVWTPVQ